MLSQTTTILNQTFQAEKDDIKPWTRGFVLKQLGVNYRGSPMVIDERTSGEVGGNPYSNDDGRVCAGDRAPDAPGLIGISGEPTRLFNMFKPWLHTVLIFGDGLAPSVLRTLGRYPDKTIQVFSIAVQGTPLAAPLNAGTVTILEDQHHHAYTGYAVDKGCDTVIVVRPDGVIGAIVFGVKGLEQYFDGIFGV
jgi:hypothetical protein